jgi:hypothetical protein
MSSITITSQDPISYNINGPITINGGFSFNYTPTSAPILGPWVSTTGVDYTAIGFNDSMQVTSDSGSVSYSIEIPASVFSTVTTDLVQINIEVEVCPPGGQIAFATETIDLFIAGQSPPPPPPHKLTPEVKAQCQSDADALNKLANLMSDIGAAADPLNPELNLAGKLAGQLASAIDPQVGTVNSTIQTAISVTSTAIKAAWGSVNPIGLTCLLASLADKAAAKLMQELANDPAEGNFTVVYQAPDWSFGTITGASTTANTLVTDSWKLLQDAANALEASQRYQGAEYAGDTASQTLQDTAFNSAIIAYAADRQAVSTDLKAYLTELQTSVSDINLTNDSSFANAQQYIAGLANPLTNDPFLAGFIASINSTAPNLSGVINGDVQQAVTAFENMQAPALTGSAFSAISSAASQLAATPLTSPTSVQQEILGLYAALYNRAADFPGFSFWVNTAGQQADSGGVTADTAATTAVTLNDSSVLGQAFVNTQNTYFNQTYGSLTDSQFINALYINLGGNAGDPGGISYWAGLLAQAEAGGQSVQAARAGLVGQFVHDLIGINLTLGAAALGLTADQYAAAVQRQEAIIDKIEVSIAYLNASQQPGGNILVAHSVTDAAFQASVTVLQGVTFDPSTVNAATIGISNAVAHQDLTLI